MAARYELTPLRNIYAKPNEKARREEKHLGRRRGETEEIEKR